MTPSDTPPGWYPDPEGTYTQRYWDGTGWTEKRLPLARKPLPWQLVAALVLVGVFVVLILFF